MGFARMPFIPIFATAVLASMGFAASVPRHGMGLDLDDLTLAKLPQVGDGRYSRSRGKQTHRKRHRNMLHVSRRVRRKHRKAA